jgi:hypothetical protein
MDEFIKIINQLRRANKNDWFYTDYQTSGKKIVIKCYNTYLQILRIDNINYGGLMDISVKKFNSELESVYKIAVGEINNG